MHFDHVAASYRLAVTLFSWVVIRITRCCFWGFSGIFREVLSPLSADAASQLDVLGHNSDPLGVDGGQVGVLEQTHQVCLSSLLESQHGAGLEPQVGLEVLGDFTHQPLEGQLADEQLGGLLVLPDLTQSDSSWSVPAGQRRWLVFQNVVKPFLNFSSLKVPGDCLSRR
jgi:hypothetical protein